MRCAKKARQGIKLEKPRTDQSHARTATPGQSPGIEQQQGHPNQARTTGTEGRQEGSTPEDHPAGGHEPPRSRDSEGGSGRQFPRCGNQRKDTAGQDGAAVALDA